MKALLIFFRLPLMAMGIAIELMLIPIAWVLEWTLLFIAILFDKIDDLSETDK